MTESHCDPPVRRLLNTETRFIRLLVALSLMIAAAPFVGVLQASFGRWWAGTLFEVVFAFMLLSAALAVATRVNQRRLTVTLALICTMLSWVAYQYDAFGLRLSKDLLAVFFLGYVIVLIVGYLFRQRRVTNDMVAGSLCAYLLIGVCWAVIYSIVNEVSPHSFNLPENESIGFTGKNTVNSLYFSLVTLTTLGFGDITPASNVARILTSAEALVGQIYLVVLVARLVGMQNAVDLGDEQQQRPSR